MPVVGVPARYAGYVGNHGLSDSEQQLQLELALHGTGSQTVKWGGHFKDGTPGDCRLRPPALHGTGIGNAVDVDVVDVTKRRRFDFFILFYFLQYLQVRCCGMLAGCPPHLEKETKNPDKRPPDSGALVTSLV